MTRWHGGTLALLSFLIPRRDVSLSELREGELLQPLAVATKAAVEQARAEKGAADKAAKESARCRHFSTMPGGTAPAVASA